MSTIYLINAHTSVLANSPIEDVVSSITGTVPLNSGFPVRVPYGLDLNDDAITTLSELLTQKAASLLASYPGYTSIVFDDMLEASSIEFANCSSVQVGDRATTSVLPNGLLETLLVALGSTPTAAVLTWELFQVSRTDPKTGAQVRTMTEVPSANMSAYASFDGGSTYIEVFDGVPFNIPAPSQGNQLVIQFDNPSSSEKYNFGSWALIY